MVLQGVIMPNSTRFTDRYIASLKPAEKQYWKREGQGFAIRIHPSGEKTWYFIYAFGGRKRYMRLGNGGYPDVSLASAREKFEVARIKVRNGTDPWEEEQKAVLELRLTPLVSEFAKLYVDHVRKHLRSTREIERVLKVEVVPRWGRRKITEITRRDVVMLRDEIAARGAMVMANRALTVVSGMFSFAVDQGILEDRPYGKIKRATKEEPRDRRLSDEEIRKFWTALDGDALMISEPVKRALKLVLITAQRPGEVAGMHVREIEGRWWTIPRERAKNKKQHRVYLTDMALEALGDLEGKEFIFPAPLGKEGPISANALSFALRRNIKGQSVVTDKVKRRKGQAYRRGPYKTTPSPETNRIGVEHFAPHDLRRTAATLMASAKVPYEVRERVLNHTLGRLDATYNTYDFDDEKVMAMEAVERKLTGILNGKPEGTVVSILTARARQAADS